MGLRDLPLWLGGHAPSALLGETREATHTISLTGGLVGVATCVTAANWGVAGFALAGAAGPQAWAAGAAGAIFGGVFALSVDRPGAFALDAQPSGRVRKLAMLGARIGACLLVSAVTAEAVLPLFLGKDSARVALEQREEKDQTRARSLYERFDIGVLKKNVSDADIRQKAAKVAAETIPERITGLEKQAKACGRQVASNRSALLARGLSAAAVRIELAPLSARCGTLANNARRELAAYHETAQKTLSEVVTEQTTAQSALASAQLTVKARLDEASRIEKEAISPLSSLVADSVLSVSPTARRRWFGLYLLLLLIELSPLGFKWASGQSAPGSRMAVDHELGVARHLRRRDDAIHADEQRLAVRDRIDEALDAVLRSSAARDKLTATFESRIEPLLSFDLARRMITEMEEFHELRRTSLRRCPDIADAINAMSDAMLDDLLARTRGRPMAWRPTAKAS